MRIVSSLLLVALVLVGLRGPVQGLRAFERTPVDSESWSPWAEADGGVGVFWRARANSYGPYMSPDCEVEFDNSTGTADFRYEIAFDGPAPYLGPKTGHAYEVSSDHKGGEYINNCTRVRGVLVSNVRRR
jgi:hypothetical protein